MEIRNKRTGLTKVIDKDKHSIYELRSIYSFYSEHKDFEVIIDGISDELEEFNV